jgi:hypothetical protein
VTGRVEVFPVEATMQAQRLAARGGRIDSEDRELDPPWDEPLDVQDVEALVEPIYEESLGRSTMGADLARVTFLDRGRVRQEGEHAEGDLGEGVRQGRTAADDALAAAGLDIGASLEIPERRGEAWAQEPPPPRSP